MKLKNKMALYVALLSGIAIVICTGVALWYSSQRMLELTIQNNCTNHSVRYASWSNAIEKALQREDSYEIQRSVVRFYTMLYGDKQSVVVCGEDVIFNPLSWDPKEYLIPNSMEQEHKMVTIDQQRYLLVGQTFPVFSKKYLYYEIKEITGVYHTIGKMMVLFVALDIFVLLVLTLVTKRLVRHVLKPLEELRTCSNKMVSGVYDQRVQIRQLDEVGELGTNFNHMAEAVQKQIHTLEDTARRQKLLLGALAHELKTPLTGIKGNAETMLMVQLNEEEQQEALVYINEECNRIEKLSQQMMEFLLLQEEQVIPKKLCHMEEIFAQVAKACERIVKEQQISLEFTVQECQIYAQPDLLLRVLINLVDNAGKASMPGGKICLAVEKHTITVQDFGCGIPPEYLKDITLPFFMVDKSRSRKAGGCGIGLALVAEIVQLHQGKLTFESEPGKGTIVYIHLPVTFYEKTI